VITRRELRLQREAAERAAREQADAARYQVPDAEATGCPGDGLQFPTLRRRVCSSKLSRLRSLDATGAGSQGTGTTVPPPAHHHGSGGSSANQSPRLRLPETLRPRAGGRPGCRRRDGPGTAVTPPRRSKTRPPRRICGVSTLILLDDAVEVSDVLALIHNKLPDLRPRLDEHGQMRLSRHSRLSSGVALEPADAAALEVPDWVRHAIVIDCPRDRQPTPPPDWFADADGLHEAFPNGMPDREEERMLSLMLSVASRLHTGVRLADEPDCRRG
jgi:hypothetical protein